MRRESFIWTDIVRCYGIVCEMQRAEEQSKYQLERLLEAGKGEHVVLAQ